MGYVNEKINFLRKFPVFRDLSDYEMEPIIDFSHTKTYNPKTIVFMQNEPITDVYFIQKGKVKIYRTDYDGKEHIVNILQNDDMFPHQGFFRKGNYPAHAEVIEESVLINIPINSFENFLLTHPDVSIKMFRVLSETIIDLQARLEEKVLYSVNDQIILLLLRLARKNGRRMKEGQYKLSVQFTNQELANMIGSSRETISRTLTQLRKKNLIKTDEDGALIIDYDTLEDSVFD